MFAHLLWLWLHRILFLNLLPVVRKPVQNAFFLSAGASLANGHSFFLHVPALHIHVKTGEIGVIVPLAGRTAQTVAVMIRFNDVAVILPSAAVDLTAMLITETAHGAQIL